MRTVLTATAIGVALAAWVPVAAGDTLVGLQQLREPEEPLTISVHAAVPIDHGVDVVAHLGGMLIEDRTNVRTISESIAVGAVRLWPMSRVWVEAGFGAARLNLERDGRLDMTSMSNVVPATVAGVGGRLYQAGPVTIDLQLRGGTAMYRPARDALLMCGVELGLLAVWH